MTEHADDAEELDELEPEVVEDLEVEEDDGEDVRGGLTARTCVR